MASSATILTRDVLVACAAALLLAVAGCEAHDYRENGLGPCGSDSPAFLERLARGVVEPNELDGVTVGVPMRDSSVVVIPICSGIGSPLPDLSVNGNASFGLIIQQSGSRVTRFLLYPPDARTRLSIDWPGHSSAVASFATKPDPLIPCGASQGKAEVLGCGALISLRWLLPVHFGDAEPLIVDGGCYSRATGENLGFYLEHRSMSGGFLDLRFSCRLPREGGLIDLRIDSVEFAGRSASLDAGDAVLTVVR